MPSAERLQVITTGPPDGEGSAGRVVVVHGAMDRSTSFGRLARRLPELTVSRYDRRGYGDSRDLGTATLDGHVSDLLEVIGGSPAVVFGHSVGGVIALVAACERRDLIPAVLAFEAPMPWLDWWPSPKVDTAEMSASAHAESFMVGAVGQRVWDRLPASTRAARLAEGEALRADIAMVSGPAPAFDPGAIPVPVLSAWGSEGAWWHRRASAELAAAAPLGVGSEVPGAGHGVHLVDPLATADLVRSASALAANAGEVTPRGR